MATGQMKEPRSTLGGPGIQQPANPAPLAGAPAPAPSNPANPAPDSGSGSSKGGSSQPAQPRFGTGASTARAATSGFASAGPSAVSAQTQVGMRDYTGGGQQARLTQANAGRPQYDSMREYQDAAYENAMNRLQPAFQAQQNSFDQRLASQGIDPTSAAGRTAASQMRRDQADAQQGALFNAMQLGLGAQAQAFGQSAQNAQMANQMGQFNAGLGQANDQFGATLGLQQGQLAQQNNQFNASLQNAMRQFNAGQQNQMGMFNAGQQNSVGMFNAGQQNQMNQFGRSLAEQGRQFDSNLQRGYTSDLMNALNNYYNYGSGQFATNQASDLNQYNARQGVLGALPGYNPHMIDVNGAANAATNSQQAAYNAQNEQSALSQAGQVAGIAGTFMGMSDRALKDNIQPMGEPDARGIQWYSWTWNDEAEAMGLKGDSMGVIAQEIPEEFTVKHDSGYLMVDYGKLMLSEVA